MVFLHGGGQNAHTWDTVIVGLGEPALAIDLPGHGRSAWREDGVYGPKRNAVTIEPVVRDLRVRRRPGRRDVAGWPDRIAARRGRCRTWCAELVLVDVTPSAPERHTEMTEAQKGTVALVQGDRSLPLVRRDARR